MATDKWLGVFTNGNPLLESDLCNCGAETTASSYCSNCGNIFPWIERVIQKAGELLQAEDGLNVLEKTILLQQIKSLIFINEIVPAANRVLELLAQTDPRTNTELLKVVLKIACPTAIGIFLGLDFNF